MRRIFIATGLICFFLVSVIIQTSTAQNRAVVIPLYVDEYPCPPCPPTDIPAPVPKTGQSTSYFIRDDGELQMGVAWPTPRFRDNLDGTVTDKLTNLIWLRNANCFGRQNWGNAHAFINSLESGECGLSDGSGLHDWRMPNIRELHSLIDFSEVDPALPSSHSFSSTVESDYYWSSTTDADSYDNNYAWCVYMDDGRIYSRSKSSYYNNYVWPVRGPE